VAEEGHSRSTLSGANPSLGLSAHAARATGSRRRKTSSRWMVGFIIGTRESPHGRNRFRGDFTRARGSRPVGLVSLERRVTTWHKTRRGLRPSSRCGDHSSWVCSYVVLFRLQKSIGGHCGSHRSSFTGQKTGSLVRGAGGERGPNPRRRTLLTCEKSWAEAEPRVKQASRDSGSMCGCAHLELGSRSALVKPPRMRAGLNPARGTVGTDA